MLAMARRDGGDPFEAQGKPSVRMMVASLQDDRRLFFAEFDSAAGGAMGQTEGRSVRV